jgi:Vitamin B12 dependent methionine synthase, activation domain
MIFRITKALCSGDSGAPAAALGDVFRLLDTGKRAGIHLTESLAKWPGSSVSGPLFFHPESRYFGTAKIERDQVEDYARRKGWSIAEAERRDRAVAVAHPKFMK